MKYLNFLFNYFIKYSTYRDNCWKRKRNISLNHFYGRIRNIIHAVFGWINIVLNYF